MNQKRPEWMNKKTDINTFARMHSEIGDLRLNTICKEARCPNVSECFSRKHATFLILGRSCTRGCVFCNVERVKPLAVEVDECERVAEAVKRLSIQYAVITSPTRDDLPDGGSHHFALTVRKIREVSPQTQIELLIPDFFGEIEALKTVGKSQPEVIGHNMETVGRLYSIRKGASYSRSLGVLEYYSEYFPKIATKSAIMLGLGESRAEIMVLLQDLRHVGCQYLCIGQYLEPSKSHYPVVEYIRPEVFEELKQEALGMGFSYVESSPYARSSYKAKDYQALALPSEANNDL